MSGKRRLLRLAFVAGPTIVQVVRRYGPTLMRLKAEHPETYQAIVERVRSLALGRGQQAVRQQAGIQKRLAVLHDQVAYLYASADNVAEAKRAEKWERELRQFDSALPMLAGMSPKQAKREGKRLAARIDRLASTILDAYIAERAEDDFVDVEVVDE